MSEISAIPPPDTSPEKAIPVPLPTPLPPPKLPSLRTLQSYLPLYLSKTDATINRLNTILSTPAGTDNFLLTICYSSLFASKVLSSISLARLHRTVREIIDKAISLPPNTTVIIDTSTIPTSRLLVTAQRLQALSSLISDFRIFVRLWGLIGIWRWAKRLLDNPPEDKLLRNIGYSQVVVNLLYQYLENGAYLSDKGILGWSKEKRSKAWLWSSRFWMAHVVLDFWRLGHQYQVKKRREVKGKEGVIGEGDDGFWAKWRRETIINVAYAPLTVHWSLEKGLVGDVWVGLLGTVVGVTGMRERWKNAA